MTDLVGHLAPGVYRWHAALEVSEARRTVEDAGMGFGHVDGRGAATRAELLAALGRALRFPAHYGQNFDALTDCLRDVGRGGAGTVLLWDDWGDLAGPEPRTFAVALAVLRERTGDARRAPFVVLLRGTGPEEAVADVPDLG